MPTKEAGHRHQGQKKHSASTPQTTTISRILSTISPYPACHSMGTGARPYGAGTNGDWVAKRGVSCGHPLGPSLGRGCRVLRAFLGFPRSWKVPAEGARRARVPPSSSTVWGLVPRSHPGDVTQMWVKIRPGRGLGRAKRAGPFPIHGPKLLRLWSVGPHTFPISEGCLP